MPKLNGSSKRYLEEKYGISSEPISSDMQEKLAKASKNANEKIMRNNAIYNQSAAHCNEAILCENQNLTEEVEGMVLKRTLK